MSNHNEISMEVRVYDPDGKIMPFTVVEREVPGVSKKVIPVLSFRGQVT